MREDETLRDKFYVGLELSRGLNLHDHIYAIGFYTGQMEKLVIGACRFCMFRPKPGSRSTLRPIIEALATEFGMMVTDVRYARQDKEEAIEFWVGREVDQYLIRRLVVLQPQSPEWHQLRAEMCGVRADYVDERYHEREGHNHGE